MPQVTLISYTGAGHPDPLYAAKLLAYTKNTRLKMTPDGFRTFLDKGPEEIAEEMVYMAATIPSSWEMVDCIFAINGISRATAQQITRTRNATFAMQSQRVTDLSGVTWDARFHEGELDQHFEDSMRTSIAQYSKAVSRGLPLEDARELLPIGVHCNLIAKYNLRALVELCRARDSLRVQGAYRSVCEEMKKATIAVWPWAETFFVPPNVKAIKMVESVAAELAAIQGDKGAMYKGLSGTLAKAADLIKKG